MKTFPSVRYLILVAACLVLTACPPAPPPTPPEAALERVDPEAFPRFADDGDFGSLLDSIDASLEYLRRLPAQRQIPFGNDAYPAAHLIRSLETFARIIAENPSRHRLNQAIAEKFYVYRSRGSGESKEVLYTGYYEPLLKASLSPNTRFDIPVYSKPKDLVEIDLSLFGEDLKGRRIIGQYTGKSVVPYPDRSKIRQDPDFRNTAPPVAWLEDEIDLFVLQIQGSGRIELEDGTQLHILFDGSNGRPYRSVGRLLIDEGHISADKMSMQAIREYFHHNPRAAQRILDHNPRYIFFKTAQDGPYGSLGQPLTPMRSLAVDRSIMPSAALAFVTLPLPRVSTRGRIEGWYQYSGFALAQDAGSAIKGPGRIDLFTGHGVQAEVMAGHLKHTGALFFLVLKPDPPAASDAKAVR